MHQDVKAHGSEEEVSKILEQNGIKAKIYGRAKEKACKHAQNNHPFFQWIHLNIFFVLIC